MDAYLKQVQELAKNFSSFELTKIPRAKNASADALVALATTNDSTLRRTIPVETMDSPSIILSNGNSSTMIDDTVEPEKRAVPEDSKAPKIKPWQYNSASI